MATASDRKSFSNIQRTAGNALPIIPAIPSLPPDVKTRFPSLAKWEAQMHEWRQKVNVTLGFKAAP